MSTVAAHFNHLLNELPKDNRRRTSSKLQQSLYAKHMSKYTYKYPNNLRLLPTRDYPNNKFIHLISGNQSINQIITIPIPIPPSPLLDLS